MNNVLPAYSKKAPAPIMTRLKVEKAEPLSKDVLGSPQRPMSARDALRRMDRGGKLHPDTWVSPGVNWAKRLRMDTAAVPLFRERDKPKEDDAYTQVQKMMTAATKDDWELKKKREQEAAEGEERKKSPTKKHTPRMGTFSSVDTGEKGRRKGVDESSIAIERRIMEQARKLEHLFQAMTSQGVMMTSTEWSTLLKITRTIWQPLIEKRIYDLEEIILEMKSDAKVELKEKGWGIRDFKSYETELAKRRATLKGLKSVCDSLVKRQVDLKSTQRMQNISQKFVRNKFLMAGMKAANTAKLFKGIGTPRRDDGSDNQGNMLITDQLFQKLMVPDVEERLQALEQLAIVADNISSVFTQNEPRESLLCCLFSHNLRVRNGAKTFVKKLFHSLPVQLVPEKRPGVNDEIDVKRDYERRKSDRGFLHKLWDQTAMQTVEIRQSTFQVLSDVIWSDDAEFMAKLMAQLDDSDSQIRVEVIKTLSKLTEGKGNMEVFNRICHMYNDTDWTVRTAVSYALPNVAGLYGAVLQAEKDSERALHEQLQQHDRLRELAQGSESTPLDHARRATISNYGRRAGSVSAQMLEEKKRRSMKEMDSAPAPQQTPLVKEAKSVLRSPSSDKSLKRSPSHKQVLFADERAGEVARKKLGIPPEQEAELQQLETIARVESDSRARLKKGLHMVQDQVHTARSMRDKTLSLLEALAEDKSWNVRRSAVHMLSKIASCGNRSAVDVLLERAEDENENVRGTAFQCLPKILTLKDVECQRVLAILLGYLDPLKNVKMVEAGVKRWPQTVRREFRKRAVECLVSIAGRGNVHVVEGLTAYALNCKDTEVRRAALEMMPDACLNGSENHHTAVDAALKCIAERSDQVRQMAAQVLPQLIDPKEATEIQSSLVNLLSHEESAVRRTVVAVIVAIAPNGGSDRAKLGMRDQLQMIAFSSGDTADIESYDDQSLMDPLLGVEEELLKKFDSPEIVAQGLVWKLNSGATGMDASHWRRRLFLMTASRTLSYISMKDGTSGKPVKILDENTLFSATRVHFGNLVPFAVKIEFEEGGADRKDLVFGFFSREELVVWVRDLAQLNRLNRQQRSEKRKAQEEKERAEAERQRKIDEGAPRGRTERLLNNLEQEVQETQRQEQIKNSGPSEHQVVLRDRLERLYHSRQLFSEYANAGRGGDSSPLRGVKGVDRAASQKMERLEMSNFMKLLRAEKIVGPTGVPGKVVMTAWRIANGLGAAGQNTPGPKSVGDNDRLLLDWNEYQECILLVAERAGVPLPVGRQPAVVRERPQTLKVRKEVADVVNKNWNNHFLFHQFATLDMADREHAHTMPGQHVVTMDFREFLALLTHLKLHPDPFSKTVLGRIYKQANSADEGVDVFDFTFDEYKAAMMMLAREYEIPVFYNGRNIAQHSAFE